MKKVIGKISSPFGGSGDKEGDAIEQATRGFEYVHHMGKEEPMLGNMAGIKPTTEPSETVKLYVTEGLWSTFLIAKLPIVDDNLTHKAVSSFSIRVPATHHHEEDDDDDDDDDDYEEEGKDDVKKASSAAATKSPPPQRELHIQGKSISTREKVVFLQGNTILAFGIKKSGSFRRDYTIYGITPRVKGQQPTHNAKLEEDYNDLDHQFGNQNKNDFTDKRPTRSFYVWMRVDENLLDNKISVDVYDGVSNHHGKKGKGFKTNVYESLRVKTGFLSANTVLWSKDGHPAMLMRQGYFPDGVKGPAWEVTVAPGIDPMLMVCFVSILDETDSGAF